MTAWNQITSHAAFPHRDSGRGFRLNGYQYISNGFQYGGIDLHDLWRTDDGVTWESVNLATPYEAYANIQTLGTTIYAVLREMWKSTDGGVNWTKIVNSGSLPFTGQSDTPLLNIDGVLTLIGPDNIWTFDETSVSWTNIGTTPGASRRIPQAEHFNGAIYVVGGCDFASADMPVERQYTGFTTKNDVWKSADGGVTWTQICADLPCEPRMWPSLCTHENKLWLAGGFDPREETGSNYTDTFYSDDGANWKRLHCAVEFTQRHAPFLFSLNGELFITAGNSNPVGPYTMNDVWKLDQSA